MAVGWSDGGSFCVKDMTVGRESLKGDSASSFSSSGRRPRRSTLEEWARTTLKNISVRRWSEEKGVTVRF